MHKSVEFLKCMLIQGVSSTVYIQWWPKLRDEYIIYFLFTQYVQVIQSHF